MIAFALDHPGLGPRRIAAQLALPMWGGLVISASGVLKVLNRHGPGTRQLRLALVAGYRAPTQPEVRTPEPPLQLEAEQPGDLVQLDCFDIRLSGTQGRCWQYTAIDVASSFVWADVRVSPVNPTFATPRPWFAKVAHELAKAGWRLKAVSTDNGSVRVQVQPVHPDGRAPRPSTASSGLAGCKPRGRWSGSSGPSWRRLGDQPSPDPWCLATRLYAGTSAVPRYYNFERGRIGRHNRGRPPAELVYGARKVDPR